MMRMLLTLAAAALVIAPLGMASVSTCPSGVGLDQYLLTTSFMCTTGNLVFSNFSYSGSANPSGIVIPASGITVTPLLTTGDEGFQFTSSWSVSSSGGPSSIDSTIFYTVSTLNHAATIDDLFLTDNAVQVGTGIANVTEQWCANNSIATCPVGSLNQIFVTDPGTPNNATATFTPITSLSVSKDISVASGTNGSATITTVTNSFSQVGVPEPASYLMFGAGLLGIGLFRKRARRR